MFDKLQKHLCRTVNSLVAASLKLLGHHRKFLSLLYQNYFGGCSSELAGLLPLPHPCGRSIRLSKFCMIFLSSFLDVVKMSMSTVSFLAQLESGILE